MKAPGRKRRRVEDAVFYYGRRVLGSPAAIHEEISRFCKDRPIIASLWENADIETGRMSLDLIIRDISPLHKDQP